MTEYHINDLTGLTRLLSAERKAFVITEQTVADKCWPHLKEYLHQEYSGPYELIVLNEQGESLKTMKTYQVAVDRIIQRGVSRSDVIIGFGGGAIGDLAGFVASTILRGIEYIGIPTTLLSQVDSAIGGKTALNNGLIKNTIGTFHPATHVFMHTMFLDTLPHEEVVSGYMEIIKMAAVADADLFVSLEHTSIEKRDNHALIVRCLDIKRKIVDKDPYDIHDIRKVLNFGHLIGHKIELQYKLRHGEAVGLGMMIEGEDSYHRGTLTFQDLLRLKALIYKSGLSNRLPFINNSHLWEGIDARIILDSIGGAHVERLQDGVRS